MKKRPKFHLPINGGQLSSKWGANGGIKILKYWAQTDDAIHIFHIVYTILCIFIFEKKHDTIYGITIFHSLNFCVPDLLDEQIRKAGNDDHKQLPMCNF